MDSVAPQDIRAGRISELDKTLGTILKLVGYDIISVRLINEWQVPIHQAIVVDNDSRHLMDTSLWRAVIVVLQKIIRLVSESRFAKDVRTWSLILFFGHGA